MDDVVKAQSWFQATYCGTYSGVSGDLTTIQQIICIPLDTNCSHEVFRLDVAAYEEYFVCSCSAVISRVMCRVKKYLEKGLILTICVTLCLTYRCKVKTKSYILLEKVVKGNTLTSKIRKEKKYLIVSFTIGPNDKIGVHFYPRLIN